ncbi:sigma-54-dependent Fis family transcriptional regulator [Desulfovibrio mangrovi]|uniref:sigma-54 interaction domain-containing protein n=1 Tax=Desulfovibrio mangrovi TaxID=2976983 RepID=UPI00224791D9|nr:sigma-54-dependent Fis family transcriptional regulator [Desulfovibrio mangrovi]UZP66069.1 sigma-54-dependent Fis family transcriptional regulator [Desulfovibrio mangrovi]
MKHHITGPPVSKKADDSPIIPVLTGLLQDSVAASSLLDGLPVGVALLDAERRIVRLNSRGEALLGIGPDEACGLPCHSVIRSSRCFKDCPLAPNGNNSGNGGMIEPVVSACPVTHDADIIDRQRRKVPVRACVVPLHDGHGKHVGFMEVLEEAHPCPVPAPSASGESGLEGFISHSPAMQPLFSALRIIAETDSTVLITGETGTGKDLLAEAIHKASDRSNGPFVKVNCGALPEHLLESELFGHVRGAFTGAVSDKPGRFRLAAGGTLFLTEIGDLPLSLQVKLLTVLDDQCIHPLGATRPVSVDVRIIAATHRNLEQMVREGKFREDLLFRLNVVRLHVPPLREREGDVRILLDHFLRRMGNSGKRGVQVFSPEALKLLCEYDWPGNVRELRNVVEYAVHFSSGETIGVSSIPRSVLERIQQGPTGRHNSPHAAPVPSPIFSPAAAEPATSSFHEPRRLHVQDDMPRQPDRQVPASPRNEPVFQSWQEKERHMILDALERTGGRRQQAAELLGWSRSTLWRKLNSHGLV